MGHCTYKTNDKFEVIEYIINDWLKDETRYCANCDAIFNPQVVKTPEGVYYESCCDNPHIVTNKLLLMEVLSANKERVEKNQNTFGSTKDKSMRSCLSLPPSLYQMLEGYFKKYGEKLFNNDKEVNKFMRKFPVFRVCETV